MRKIEPASLPRWSAIVWRLAGFYNLTWALWALFFPSGFYATLGVPAHFQGLPAMLLALAVFGSGVAYWMAAAFPARFWWVAALGFLGKLAGGAITAFLIAKGYLPIAFSTQIFLNDLIWLPFFAVISYSGLRAMQDTTLPDGAVPFPKAMQEFRDQQGVSLARLQREQPILLVFLRHFGCTFCKEMLGDLAGQLPQIEREGKKLVLVHMGTEAYAAQYFAHYGLAGQSRISDPTCRLYEAFELKRATFGQVFGWQSWWRGLQAFLQKGHSVGKLVGDGFRMPGAFVVYRNHLLESFRHQQASDIPNYQALMSCPVEV